MTAISDYISHIMEVFTCTSCGGEIIYIPPPSKSKGSGCWEGYRHLASSKEHFSEFGWVDQ